MGPKFSQKFRLSYNSLSLSEFGIMNIVRLVCNLKLKAEPITDRF